MVTTFLSMGKTGWESRDLPDGVDGLAPAPAPRYYCGLDLGQAADYSAFTIAEQVDVPTGATSTYTGRPITEKHFHIRYLERFPLQTSYPSIVSAVVATLAAPPLGDPKRVTLAVDATGVGAPVVDLLRLAKPRAAIRAVTITGGDKEISHGMHFNVPKRDLVSRTQVFLQSRRLLIAASLPQAEVLTAELAAFQVKISDLGHDSYGAWREGQHDDLVLAVALAVWAGERGDLHFEVF